MAWGSVWGHLGVYFPRDNGSPPPEGVPRGVPEAYREGGIHLQGILREVFKRNRGVRITFGCQTLLKSEVNLIDFGVHFNKLRVIKIIFIC